MFHLPPAGSVRRIPPQVVAGPTRHATHLPAGLERDPLLKHKKTGD